MRILMCNVAWMRGYQGIDDDDYPVNGGGYIKENGYGHEVINFKKNGRYVYGYVQARNATINVDRLDGERLDYVDDVLVVWRARSSIGSVVIGWYKHARVYRKVQPANSKRKFSYNGELHSPGYLIRAETSNAFLLPVENRVFPVPVTHKGFGSQTFVSFLDSDLPEVLRFKKELGAYIDRVGNGDFSPPKKGKRGVIDIETKFRIEKKAIDAVVEFYVSRGYDVESVERDNVGYDLRAENEKHCLKIEVKGTSVESEESVSVILTPNEYRTSSESRASYRICIVYEALGTPRLLEFAWDSDESAWFCEQNLRRLNVVELTAANLRISAK